MRAPARRDTIKAASTGNDKSMHRATPHIAFAAIVALALSDSSTFAEEATSDLDPETVIYDESKQGDLGPVRR